MEVMFFKYYTMIQQTSSAEVLEKMDTIKKSRCFGYFIGFENYYHSYIVCFIEYYFKGSVPKE